MRKSFFINLFSFLLISFLAGCSDEEKINYGPYVDPNTQVLTVTQNEVTPSTFTFSVEAENKDIPYVAMHIDKATIDGVAKSNLPEYLMGELEAKATAEGVSPEEYLAKVSHKGNISNQRITALKPGSVYELVAFAFTGTEPATKMESIFFETPAIEKPDFSFEVTPTITDEPYILGFKATSAVADDDDTYYFPTLFYKSSYDLQLTISYKDVILNNTFADFWDQAMGMSGNDEEEALEILLKNGILLKELTEDLVFAGLDADDEYKFLMGAYKFVEVNGSRELMLVSDVAEAEARTPACNPDDTEAPDYKVSYKYTGDAMLEVTVTPPLGYNGSFVFGVLSDGEGMPTDPNELRDLYLTYLKQQNVNPESYTEEASGAFMDVYPGTRMKVIVFEYNYGPLSSAKVEKIEMLEPDYSKLATLTAKVKSTYDFDFDLSDGSTTVPYYISLGNGSDNDMNTKDKVSKALNEAYLNLRDFGMELNDFFYGNSNMGYTPNMMGIYVGNQEFNSGYLQPLYDGSDYKPYKLYCYPLEASDDEGTPITVRDAIEVDGSTELRFSSTDAPKFTAKYFTSEDAGEVFGKEYPEDRIMVVMDYNAQPGSASAGKTWYGIVKDNAGVTATMNDVDIVYNYKVDWKELPGHKLVFTMCGKSQYYGLTYTETGSEETALEYSKVDRVGLINEGEIEYGTKDELQALYDKAFNPAPVQPSEPSESKYVSPFMRKPSVSMKLNASKVSYSPVLLMEKASMSEKLNVRTVSEAKASAVGVAY